MSKLIPITNEFYFSSFKNGIDKKPEWVHEPLAQPIKIPTLENVDLFLIEEGNGNGLKYWNISEGYAGFRLYKSYDPETKQDAINNLLADMAIKKITAVRVKELINKNVQKYGLSPRYKKLKNG